MPMLTTVSIGLPVTPVPLAAAHLVGEGVHLVQHLVHLGTTSIPSTTSSASRGVAQRGVQHGPVLGDVDVLAGEHGVATLGQPDLLGQLDQGGQHRVVDQVLRQVDVQVAGGAG